MTTMDEKEEDTVDQVAVVDTILNVILNTGRIPKFLKKKNKRTWLKETLPICINRIKGEVVEYEEDE